MERAKWMNQTITTTTLVTTVLSNHISKISHSVAVSFLKEHKLIKTQWISWNQQNSPKAAVTIWPGKTVVKNQIQCICLTQVAIDVRQCKSNRASLPCRWDSMRQIQQLISQITISIWVVKINSYCQLQIETQLLILERKDLGRRLQALSNNLLSRFTPQAEAPSSLSKHPREV